METSSRGQLGHGDLENCDSFREISTLGCVTSKIACGLWHSVCVTEAGDVFSWGWNESGQLGVPCFSDRSVLEKHFPSPGVVDDLEAPLTIHAVPVMVTFPVDDWSIVDVRNSRVGHGGI